MMVACCGGQSLPVLMALVLLSPSGSRGELVLGFCRAVKMSLVAAVKMSRLESVGIFVLWGNQATVSVICSDSVAVM